MYRSKESPVEPKLSEILAQKGEIPLREILILSYAVPTLAP